MKDNFQKYAVKHMGMSSNTINDYMNHVVNLHTPNVVETSDSSKRMSLINIFDRLMSDKTIHISNEVNQLMADILICQLIYLDTLDTNVPITIITDSGGGSVRAGLTIYDSINLSKTPIDMTCAGMAASMMSVLSSTANTGDNGVKGVRRMLKHAEFMLHQVSYGSSGSLVSNEIAYQEARKKNSILFSILAKNTGKTKEEIIKDSPNDKWLNSVESLKYGLVDEILWEKNKIITLDNVSEVENYFN